MRRLALSLMLAAITALFAPRAHAQAAPDMEILPPVPKEVGFDQNIGQSLPLDAVFHDEAGQTVHLGDYFANKPVVLSLAYFSCPMLCGLSMQGLSSSLRGMNLAVGKDFEVLTVSFDPSETPEMARAKKAQALARYGHLEAASSWHFLTGDKASIDRLTSAAGFRYTWDAAAKQFAHPTGIVVATPEGKIARYLFGIEYASKDLRLSLVEASKGHLGSVVDQLLLLCYHYDPATGRYGRIAIDALRGAGILTLVALIALITVMWVRERKSRKKKLVAVPGGALQGAVPSISGPLARGESK
jgi:protein SCO1/2